MGGALTPVPTEAAPAYGDLYQGSSNPRYSIVPIEDVEGHAHRHEPSDTVPGQDSHAHCEVCDRQQDRRERRAQSRKNCETVSRTFIYIFLFLMIFGIVLVRSLKH